MARWLGIDHGEKRIGIAVGNTTDGVATPLAVVPAKPLQTAFQKISQLFEQYGAEGVVVGLPVNMDGTEGPQAKQARDFAALLAENIKINIRLFDERLSSFAADKALAGTMTRKQKKARHDAIAAAEMLRDFLSQL